MLATPLSSSRAVTGVSRLLRRLDDAPPSPSSAGAAPAAKAPNPPVGGPAVVVDAPPKLTRRGRGALDGREPGRPGVFASPPPAAANCALARDAGETNGPLRGGDTPASLSRCCRLRGDCCAVIAAAAAIAAARRRRPPSARADDSPPDGVAIPGLESRDGGLPYSPGGLTISSIVETV